MPPTTPAESKPAVYVLSWGEVLQAIGLNNNPTNRRRVKRLAQFYNGPLHFPGGRGGQPKADRDKLLTWWDALEATWAEAEARCRDRKATVARNQRHKYGRSAEVVPGIAASVKQRRHDS